MNLGTKKQRMAQFTNNLPIAPSSDSCFIHFTPRIETLRTSIIHTGLKDDRSVPGCVAAVELGVLLLLFDTKLSHFPNSAASQRGR